MVGTNEDVIFEETNSLLVDKAAYAKMSKAVNPYGDGHASEKIVHILADFTTCIK